MIKIILSLSLFSVVLSLSAQKESKIKYSNLFAMSAKVLQNIQDNNFPSYVQKTGKGLVVESKFKFVILGNQAIVVPAEFANSDHTSGYQTFFKKVGETRKPDGSMFCTYCSCGGNAMWTSGDTCQPYESSDGWHCEGGCLGENQGKTCSFTQVHYPPVGGGSPRAREVSF